MDYLNNNNN